eukprot:gene3276-4104_t
MSNNNSSSKEEHRNLNINQEEGEVINQPPPQSRNKKPKIDINNIKSKWDKNPEEKASFFSKRTFTFLNPLLNHGVKEPLQYEDIYPTNPRDKSSTVYPIFKRIWNPNSNLSQVDDNSHMYTSFSSDLKKKKSLLRALNSAFGFKYHLAFFLKLIGDLAEFVFPIVIYYLVEFVQDPEQPYWWGLIYTGILMAGYLVNTFFTTTWDYIVTVISYKVRTSLICSIYEKSLNISNFVREKENSTKGNTITLITVDVETITVLFEYFHLVATVPIQLIISGVLLYRLLKYSVLIGFGTLILFVPLNFIAAMKQSSLTEKVMKLKDDRTSKVTESIHSIRVLKFYGWTQMMYDKIQKLRSIEVGQLKVLGVVNSLLYLLWMVIPDVVTVTSFAAYALFGNELQISTIISALSLFNLVSFPLSLLPHILSGVAVSFVSVARVEKFLLNEELEKLHRSADGSMYYGQVDPEFDSNQMSLSFKDSSFTYPTVDGVENEEEAGKDGDEKESKESKEKKEEIQKLNEGFDAIPIKEEDQQPKPDTLRNLTLTFPKGSFTTIIGPIASGKSSILSAILGNMKITKGSLTRNGTISYVSQIPWIFNGTIRENILFGIEMNDERYEKVIKSCCLEQDLQILPGGDNCEIGERGINLSGGQKMRVSIARAIYAESDIYLFDDPLASLDVGVSHKLFHQAIRSLSPSKTCILVTHQLFPLEFSDNIIQIRDGTIEKIGSYDQYPQESWDILKFEQEQEKDDKKGEKKEEGKEKDKDEEEEDDEEGELIGDEERNVGVVKASTYKCFLKNVGVPFIIVISIFSIANQGFSTFGSFWIATWSQAMTENQKFSIKVYLAIYCASSAFSAISTFIQQLCINFGGLYASQNFHNKSLYKVLRSPIQFFDQNLSGRIINRFSKDISKLDSSLPQSVGDSLSSFLGVIAIIVVIGIASPMVLVLLIPLFFLIWYLKRWYLNNQREIQRIASVSNSPVITNFSETLSGQQIIRAFQASDRFMQDNMKNLDFNTSVLLLSYFISFWSTFRLEIGCSLLVCATALSATFLRQWISPALIGLALSYSVTLSGQINWMFSNWTSVETQMNSVERLQHYCDLDEERPDRVDSIDLPSSWPSEGRVEFINYSMRYRDELDLSLRNINLLIQPGMRVGIAGRTGAGKSSLLQSLFRLVEGCEGSIVIDGYDIAKIGLMDLRTKLSIIPQDPVLFAGSLRYNLDPFDQFTDSEIWNILERVHIKEKVKSLDVQVSEDGQNLSVGERQLMCMARALLRKSKIIALDEATAAVDMETDRLIQNTIKEEFKNSTVITIAHRLNTIMDYDVVVLMSEGTIKQVGKPSEVILLQQQQNNGSPSSSQLNLLEQDVQRENQQQSREFSHLDNENSLI